MDDFSEIIESEYGTQLDRMRIQLHGFSAMLDTLIIDADTIERKQIAINLLHLMHLLLDDTENTIRQ